MARKPKHKDKDASGVDGPPGAQPRPQPTQHTSGGQEKAGMPQNPSWAAEVEAADKTEPAGNRARDRGYDRDPDQMRKRSLPQSAEKATAGDAPPSKKSYADRAKVNDGRIRVTVCITKDDDVVNLNKEEVDKLVDRITLESWDLPEVIRIHKTGLYGGRATVFCADQAAVRWIKELVPKIDPNWTAFKPGEGAELAEYGGLIPNEIVRMRTIGQVADKIGQNLGGAKVRLVSTVAAKTSETDRLAGIVKDGQYIRIGLDTKAAERLEGMNRIVWLGPFKVTFRLRRKAAPPATDDIEMDLQDMQLKSPEDPAAEDLHLLDSDPEAK